MHTANPNLFFQAQQYMILLFATKVFSSQWPAAASWLKDRVKKTNVDFGVHQSGLAR